MVSECYFKSRVNAFFVCVFSLGISSTRARIRINEMNIKRLDVSYCDNIIRCIILHCVTNDQLYIHFSHSNCVVYTHTHADDHNHTIPAFIFYSIVFACRIIRFVCLFIFHEFILKFFLSLFRYETDSIQWYNVHGHTQRSYKKEPMCVLEIK